MGVRQPQRLAEPKRHRLLPALVNGDVIGKLACN